jgi:hypothetical protein
LSASQSGGRLSSSSSDDRTPGLGSPRANTTWTTCRAARFDPTVGLKVTSRAAIANAPFPVEGNGSFSNVQLAACVLLVPYLLSKFVPYFSFKTTYGFLLVVTALPTTVAYWLVMSRANVRVRDSGIFPGKNLEDYIDIKDAHLREQYNGQKKIPMQVFHDAYFEGKIDIKGPSLLLLDSRDPRADHLSAQVTCSSCSSGATTGPPLS